MSDCTNCTFEQFCSIDSSRSKAAPQYLKKREILQFDSQSFSKLYVIRRGGLKIFKVSTNGNELIRRFYFANEVYGFEAISSNRYHDSAAAFMETKICDIPYSDVLRLLHKKPELQKYFIYLMSQQINVGTYLILPASEQRLAAFLIDLNSRLHCGEPKLEFSFPLSRNDIGCYLGLSGETVSRLLSYFHQSQLISVQHKKIKILQLDKLKKLASG